MQKSVKGLNTANLDFYLITWKSANFYIYYFAFNIYLFRIHSIYNLLS